VGQLPRVDVTFEVFYDRLLDQIAKMEHGVEITLADNTPALLIAGINVATQDLPQGNDKAMVKRQNATVGCRSCDCSKEDLPKMDEPHKPRLHHRMLATRAEMQILNRTAAAEKEKDTGILATSSPFETISFDLSLPHHTHLSSVSHGLNKQNQKSLLTLFICE